MMDKYEYQYMYLQGLKKNLQARGYIASKYFRKDEIDNIIVDSLKYFCKEFEKWVINNIKNFNDILNVIGCYSGLKSDVDSKRMILEEELTDFLHTCRYILAISPFLKLDYTAARYTSATNMFFPELLTLTYLIQLYNQYRCINSLCPQDIIVADFTSSYLSLDYSDSSYMDLLSPSKLKGQELLATNLVDYDLGLRFGETLKATFGKAAESLLAFMQGPDPIYDLNQMSFSDFIAITNGTHPNPTKFIQDDETQYIPFDMSKGVLRYLNDPFITQLILFEKDTDLLSVIINPMKQEHRTRFKPIIELNCNGKKVYYTTRYLIFETFSELASNQLPFHGLPEPWKKHKAIKKLADEAHKKVSDEFEDLIASNLEGHYTFFRNITFIDNVDLCKTEVCDNGIKTGRNVGEIDFLIVNHNIKTLYVADAKYIKSKYYLSTFYSDKSKFDKYLVKLLDKSNWISANLNIASKLFKCDLSNYTVQPLFVTDSYLFYSIFFDYPIIPLKGLLLYVESNDKLCFLRS